MEVVAVEGRISGAEVIADLCDRIAEQLGKSCDLRQTDSYAGYSAAVTVQLQLIDVDTTQVVAGIVVGAHNAQQPSQRIAVNVAPVDPEAVRERLGSVPAPSLERTADGSGPDERRPAAAASGKRYYTPRNRPKPGLS